MSEPPAAINLFLETTDPFPRCAEPVTCGVPWPRGRLAPAAQLRLIDDQNNSTPFQARVLDQWPDGSVRWLLLDWQATLPAGATAAHYRLELNPVGGSHPLPASALQASLSASEAVIQTGAVTFRLPRHELFRLHAFRAAPAEELATVQLTVDDASGRQFEPHLDDVSLAETGPIRTRFRLRGRLAGPGAPRLDFDARLDFFAGSPVVAFAITLRNPRRAQHPGNYWELGDPGSLLLRDVSIVLTPAAGSTAGSVACSPEPGAPFHSYRLPFELYQDSSGGENWQSTNHVNRDGIVPNQFRGYRLRAANVQTSGLRATPIVSVATPASRFDLEVPHFWQNFPKAIEVTSESIALHLFPRQYGDLHELQGGEQKTHRFHVAFGIDPVTADPLIWCRAPLRPRAAPESYCYSGVIPYLTPRAVDRNDAYLRLVDAAIEGRDTFDHKRAVIDEYGWRHFGDIYGDHEAVRHQGPQPIVSHYNNQYDPLAGFAYQFLRSGDWRWWRHCEELAWHVIDIDLYHTDEDKSAYNHGLFWHTFHYFDVGKATHRSYPRTPGVVGGGPSAEQCYAGGLALYYFLTGDPLARESVLELCAFALAIDEGGRTIYRWLDRGPTGLASATGSPLYHGPGRGPGNLIHVLLEGFRLTAEPRFQAKAEQLIRRCIHPDDDLPARNLQAVERRWYYTVFLQALGRYLDFKLERNELDERYAYARASLLRYARWMAEHEYPYLEKPQILEYPTETWAAQDMRKSEVFKYAAKHAEGPEREQFWDRAVFFFDYATRTLSTMPTRSLARPVALLLSYGWMHAYFQQHPAEQAPPAAITAVDFGRPEVFVPQKVRAKRRFLLLAASLAAAMIVGIGWVLKG